MEYLGQVQQKEWRQAHIDLLEKPVILALEEPAAYRRILFHEKKLKEWYQGKLGWVIERTRSMIRLSKEPARLRNDSALPLLTNVTDFVLFTVILWYGESLRQRNVETGSVFGAQVFVLSEMAEKVEEDFFPLYLEGKTFRLTRREDRQALVRALRSLMRLGAIRKVDGDDAQWSQNQSGDVLYEFTDMASRILGRKQFDSLNSNVEQRVLRTLLLGPALYRIDDSECFDWVVEHRTTISSQIEYRYGEWGLFVGKDYACLLRSEGSSEAPILQFRSAIHHPVLFICSTIRDQLMSGDIICQPGGFVVLSDFWIENQLAILKSVYVANWGTLVGRYSLPQLKTEVLAEMEQWDMIRPDEQQGYWRFMPLAARFYPKYAGVDEVGQDD